MGPVAHRYSRQGLIQKLDLRWVCVAFWGAPLLWFPRRVFDDRLRFLFPRVPTSCTPLGDSRLSPKYIPNGGTDLNFCPDNARYLIPNDFRESSSHRNFNYD